MWNKLARFVAGESTSAEQAEVRAWAEEDVRHAEVLESVKRTWATSGEAGKRWDTAAAWESVRERMDVGADALAPARRPMLRELYGSTPRMPAPGSPAQLARRHWAVAATLAAVAVGGSLGLGFWAGGRTAIPAVAVEELITKKGERVEIRLSDGTRVTLAPESRLRVSAQADEPTREVDLVGEAYFDVASDAERPFVIVAGSTVTRVLGTEFGVRAYPSDSTIQVAVADGRVTFHASGTSEADAVLLRPGELGRFEVGSDQITRQAVNLDAYLGWQQGRLAFDDTPLSQVAAQLERWYGIPVRIGDASLRGRRVTASFRDQPVDEVIAVVAATLGLEYARVGQVYTFLPKDRIRTLARF
jgi:transmembrane sensor